MLQVLPTEKAMQLLREGKAGSGDFSAADEASRKMLRSLMDNRAEAKQGTSGQAFYGEPTMQNAQHTSPCSMTCVTALHLRMGGCDCPHDV